MDCKKMKEIILTDYIDGNLKGAALGEAEAHLALCPECRALAEEARSAGISLRSAPRHEAPPQVWDAIRSEVDSGRARPRLAEGVLERLKYLLPRPRPAFVMATAVALLLFSLTTARLMPGNGYILSGTEEDDMFFVSSINDGDKDSGFGTNIEYFFL